MGRCISFKAVLSCAVCMLAPVVNKLHTQESVNREDFYGSWNTVCIQWRIHLHFNIRSLITWPTSTHDLGKVHRWLKYIYSILVKVSFGHKDNLHVITCKLIYMSSHVNWQGMIPLCFYSTDGLLFGVKGLVLRIAIWNKIQIQRRDVSFSNWQTGGKPRLVTSTRLSHVQCKITE